MNHPLLSSFGMPLQGHLALCSLQPNHDESYTGPQEFGCTDDESCAKANRQLTVAIKDRDLTRVEVPEFFYGSSQIRSDFQKEFA